MPAKQTIFEQLVGTVWRKLRDDADFAELFPPMSRRDYASIFEHALVPNAADCPMVGIRVASFDLSRWANNKQLAIPVAFEARFWLATESQADALQAAVVLATPLLDQLDLRFGLGAYLTDFAIQRVTLGPVADAGGTEDNLQLLGVFWTGSVPFTCDLRRDPRSRGLYAD